MTSPVKNLIEIKNLTHDYGSVRALDNVSLEIRENEFFALLGPSGCGKTTLLRILAGFETPLEGSVTLAGQDLISLPANKRPINLMFQSYALFPHMNVGQNVAYGLEREKLPKAEIKSRVEEVLKTVGLQDKVKARPSQLSGGQRQRVGLARAIYGNPEFIVLDEPNANLDDVGEAALVRAVQTLREQKCTVFMVVHQRNLLSIADRVLVMNQGEVSQFGTLGELAASAQKT